MKVIFTKYLTEGEHPKITDRKQVTCECSISLLDGTLCYKIKNKTFVVGASEEIYGLHHAIKLLGKGGKVRFIFPSHLAYGIRGDFDKIPPHTILLYGYPSLRVIVLILKSTNAMTLYAS